MYCDNRNQPSRSKSSGEQSRTRQRTITFAIASVPLLPDSQFAIVASLTPTFCDSSICVNPAFCRNSAILVFGSMFGIGFDKLTIIYFRLTYLDKDMKFNRDKTAIVHLGGDRRFSLTDLHDGKLWTACENFYAGLMNCRDVFGIPDSAIGWGLMSGSQILDNGGLEIKLSIEVEENEYETRSTSILPKFVYIS